MARVPRGHVYHCADYKKPVAVSERRVLHLEHNYGTRDYWCEAWWTPDNMFCPECGKKGHVWKDEQMAGSFESEPSYHCTNCHSSFDLGYIHEADDCFSDRALYKHIGRDDLVQKLVIYGNLKESLDDS